MIGLAISSVSVVPMPEVNSSPRKLTAPPGLFETVSKYRSGVDPKVLGQPIRSACSSLADSMKFRSFQSEFRAR
ncbi:hypothetical protein A8F39_31315 [Burkholderia cenocepacia]|nr:hypothetical protein A8F39_31315 [Burkholderia cenocepacia]ONZ10742.1 hypothetical protein A8F40_03710 [Burkholderia cenocepacia]